MDLLLPCNSSISLHRKPGFQRTRSSFASETHTALRCCRQTTSSELQTPVGATGTSGNYYSPASVPTHKVTVHDRQRGAVHEFLVPEDQYILHTAESQNVTLPFACRHGCCTSCAVRVKSGQIRQPEALGIFASTKFSRYKLVSTCVVIHTPWPMHKSDFGKLISTAIAILFFQTPAIELHV
ncbi:ferredoxin C 2, chloroplastic-like isoform X3 [Tripterygium wilfordii]|uniref:ferredoxin C 2, chloroplastic-like isoform X3 n=1 Tax=Tripterygium wilfordii TaxID=458696 RepID=UPI0018F822D8|nr:ferredoxin C 2, chloroplastic-like isoform X3 [Tripterygium wilfordii]